MNKIAIFFLLIFLDFISKLLIKNNLTLNQTIELNFYLNIVYIKNYGVSFGLLSGLVPHWFLIIIGLLVTFLIFYLMYFSKDKIERLAYFTIIIGAISNILDRSINTYVVDFISLNYKSFYWPAFNFADIYITIGIIMLIISFFRSPESNK